MHSRAEWHKLPEILWGHIQQTPAHWPCSPNVNVCFWQLLQETVKTFTTNSVNFHKNSDNFHKRQYNNFHKEQWHSHTMNLWWPQGRSRAGLAFFSFDNLTPYFLLSDIWWQTTNSFLLALNTHNWPPRHSINAKTKPQMKVLIYERNKGFEIFQLSLLWRKTQRVDSKYTDCQMFHEERA